MWETFKSLTHQLTRITDCLKMSFNLIETVFKTNIQVTFTHLGGVQYLLPFSEFGSTN